MKKNLLIITVFIYCLFSLFAGKPISKEPSPLSVIESEEDRNSWCEKDGYAINIHYWLYDSYRFHNGDISELIYDIVPKWFQTMKYIAISDYYITAPNTVLADSVKDLMKKNNCDVSIAFVESSNYIVINSYDEDSTFYTTYIIYVEKEEMKEKTVSKTSYFVQHDWYEEPPYTMPKGFKNTKFITPTWYESSKLNDWKAYLTKNLSKEDLQLLIAYIDKDITKSKKEYSQFYSNKYFIKAATSYMLTTGSNRIPNTFKVSGNMSDSKFAELLKSAVDSSNYSKKPLTIMDFTGNSTRIDVEKQLNEWGIECGRYFAGDGNEFDEDMYNLFGAGSTIVYDIKWNGITFEEMIFHYSEGNKLAKIEMYPDNTNSSREIKEIFDVITKDYPIRKHVSSNNKDHALSLLIKNGFTEEESAVLLLNGPYYYAFFFQGHQLMNYPELNEW